MKIIMQNIIKLVIIFSTIIFTSCEQSSEPQNNKLPDNTVNKPKINYEIPRYTNYDSFYLNGKLIGQDSVFCEGGLKKVSASVNDSLFYLDIPLHKNTTNKLYIFGKNSFNQLSDTLIISIIHDDIPPILISSEVIAQMPLKYKFDSPIRYTFVKASNSYFKNIQSSYSGNNEEVSFSWPEFSYYIGEEFPISITFADSANNLITINDTIKSCIAKLNINGSIRRVIFSEQEDLMFVLRLNFDDILVYDTKDWKLYKTLQLKFSPRNIAFNPYNNLLYCIDYRQGKIVVINPNSNQIVKEIILKYNKDIANPPDDPINIAFGNNGIGLITAEPYESPCGQCVPFIIDSKNNDALTIPDGFDEHDFRSLAVNVFNNGNKIALTDMCTTTGTILIFDCNTMEFTTSETPGGYINYVFPDKLTSRFGTTGSQGLHIIKNGLKSNYFGMRSFFMSFSNINGNQNKAYYIDDYDAGIGILDLQTNQKIPKGLCGTGLGFHVSKDDKFIINVYESSILVFETRIIN